MRKLYSKVGTQVVVLMLLYGLAECNGPTWQNIFAHAEKCNNDTHFSCPFHMSCCNKFTERCTKAFLSRTGCVSIEAQTMFPTGGGLKECCRLVQNSTRLPNDERRNLTCVHLLVSWNRLREDVCKDEKQHTTEATTLPLTSTSTSRTDTIAKDTTKRSPRDEQKDQAPQTNCTCTDCLIGIGVLSFFGVVGWVLFIIEECRRQETRICCFLIRLIRTNRNDNVDVDHEEHDEHGDDDINNNNNPGANDTSAMSTMHNVEDGNVNRMNENVEEGIPLLPHGDGTSPSENEEQGATGRIQVEMSLPDNPGNQVVETSIKVLPGPSADKGNQGNSTQVEGMTEDEEQRAPLLPRGHGTRPQENEDQGAVGGIQVEMPPSDNPGNTLDLAKPTRNSTDQYGREQQIKGHQDDFRPSQQDEFATDDHDLSTSDQDQRENHQTLQREPNKSEENNNPSENTKLASSQQPVSNKCTKE